MCSIRLNRPRTPVLCHPVDIQEHGRNGAMNLRTLLQARQGSAAEVPSIQAWDLGKLFKEISAVTEKSALLFRTHPFRTTEALDDSERVP